MTSSEDSLGFLGGPIGGCDLQRGGGGTANERGEFGWAWNFVGWGSFFGEIFGSPNFGDRRLLELGPGCSSEGNRLGYRERFQ